MGRIVEIVPRRKKRRRNILGRFLLLMIVIGIIGGAGYGYYTRYWPNSTVAAPYPGQSHPIWFEHALWNGKEAYVKDGQVYLPYSFIRERVDPYLFWDKSIDSLILTTKDQVLRLPNQQISAFLNEKPFPLSVPMEEIDGEPYLPLNIAERFYPYQFDYHPDTGVLVVKPFGFTWQTAQAAGQPEKGKGKPLRAGPSVREPLYTYLSPQEKVEVLGEENGWVKVLTEKGIAGYVEKRDLFLSELKKIEAPKEEKNAYTPWSPLGKPVNLTWEHVVRKTPDPGKIGALKGVNVISPTWFEIADEKGTVANKADLAYVEWAHQRGYKVWGLISNGFDPDRTHAFLSDFETRRTILRQMLQLAHLYKLDGFNLDFENVYLQDRENLVQFVREITPYLHEMDLTVSMDVTIKSESETWSKFYDRKALGETVDYVAVMTYDEHYAGSPVSGSVASLPWVEKGLQGILEEVPASKVLLGVPFYTRLWSETEGEGGKVTVKQKALSMEQAAAWIKERKLTPIYDEVSGQMYVEYKDPKSNVRYKMWLEDSSSMKKRAALVKKYGLAGMASWRRGFEVPEIWNTIADAWAK